MERLLLCFGSLVPPLRASTSFLYCYVLLFDGMYYLVFFFRLLCALTLVADCVQLIRENGFRDQSYFYHLGDGTHAYHANLETAKAIYFKCVMYSTLRCTGRAIMYINGRFIHSKPQTTTPIQTMLMKDIFVRLCWTRSEERDLSITRRFWMNCEEIDGNNHS